MEDFRKKQSFFGKYIVQTEYRQITIDETTFKNLRCGDIVRHKIEKRGMIVTGNYGGRVTVVRTEDITNSDEWVLIEKAAYNNSLPPGAI